MSAGGSPLAGGPEDRSSLDPLRREALLVLGCAPDADGLASYRLRVGERFAPLVAARPEGLRASARDASSIAVELPFRACREPLASELQDAIRRYETLRFEVPARSRTLVLDGAEPLIVGILNRTPDSFSDGGLLADLDALFSHAEKLIRDGARWLDLGGESTRPGAAPVGLEEELARVMPAIEGLARRFDAWLSIDTRKSEVARAAILAGADVVNDVSGGLADPRLLATCAELGAPLVLNHLRGTPETMQRNPTYADVLAEVARELEERRDASLNAGIALPRILLDPGFGFGKRLEDNVRLLASVGSLRTIGRPLFAGTSRKSFLGALLLGREASDRDDATSATTAILAAQGVSAIRVHDARRAADVARVAARIARESRPAPWYEETGRLREP